MTMIGYASKYWLEFDGWCLSNNIAPLEMPSRRFFSAVWRWMTEGLDEQQIDSLLTQIDQTVYEAESRARKTASSQEKEESKVIPYKPFQAPPGWKPPGWSDEAAYYNSVAGMSGIMNAGGGKIGGSVK